MYAIETIFCDSNQVMSAVGCIVCHFLHFAVLGNISPVPTLWNRVFDNYLWSTDFFFLSLFFLTTFGMCLIKGEKERARKEKERKEHKEEKIKERKRQENVNVIQRKEANRRSRRKFFIKRIFEHNYKK